MTTGELIKLILRFYKENKDKVKPQRCTYVDTTDPRYTACCGLGAGYLAIHGIDEGINRCKTNARFPYSYSRSHPVREFFISQGISRDWLEGFISGFDYDKPTSLDKRFCRSDYIKGRNAGAAVCRKVFQGC